MTLSVSSLLVYCGLRSKPKLAWVGLISVPLEFYAALGLGEQIYSQIFSVNRKTKNDNCMKLDHKGKSDYCSY